MSHTLSFSPKGFEESAGDWAVGMLGGFSLAKI
jgi:hypothetical protein